MKDRNCYGEYDNAKPMCYESCVLRVECHKKTESGKHPKPKLSNQQLSRKEYHRKRMMKVTEKRILNNNCGRCGKPVTDSHWKCKACRDCDAKWHRERKERKYKDKLKLLNEQEINKELKRVSTILYSYRVMHNSIIIEMNERDKKKHHTNTVTATG